MKRALIISYYWPPSGGSGVQRWVKFAKYLPSEGWQPVIYTPENPELTAIDESLCKEIPPEAEIIRTHITEPYDLYRRLTENPHISLTGIKGDDTMSSVALSLVGDVVEVGPGYLDVLLKENPYMLDIYPTEASRSALTVFRIHRGSGEWFDLSKKPIERAEFSFGDFCSGDSEYVISGSCDGCGACLEVCPQSCIDDTAVPFRIRQENCLRCGNCASICPNGAVSLGGMR